MTGSGAGSGAGKVILLGEHAVVYGHAALAGALDRRVVVEARPAERLSVEIPAWGIREAPEPMVRAISAIAANLNVDTNVALTVDAGVPARAGLGSSAALAVAVTRALAPGKLSFDETEAIAGLAERAFHGNPSGVDVALAARGGLGIFRRGAGLLPIAARPLRLAIGLSGEPRDTAARVADVAARRERDLEATDRILERLGQLAEGALLGDPAGLGERFDEAQLCLSALGLSSPGLDRLVELARHAGAFGAKLTGAGGGGAAIACAAEPEAIVAAWTAAGFAAFVAEVGA